mmetsp:Transcript_22768/g.36324  ORF Transcript_22768/g.36324 Transcript_22768/m.36324 type:complete len:283 (+) Transcript_22768:91-939(+)
MEDIIKETASGAFGAVCCITAGQPFDTIKTRLQSGKLVNGIKSSGPFSCAYNTVKYEGVRALFKGYTPALASATVENCVVWTVNSSLRSLLIHTVLHHTDSESFHITNPQQAALGAVTGAVSSVCICPAEVIKVRLQTSTVITTPAAVVKNLIRQDGFRGLFFGVRALLMRDVPYYFLFFGAMETYFDKVAPNGESLFHAALGGGVAGSFAWAVVFPVDVVKTHQQVYGGKVTLAGTFRHIVNTLGIQGLYRGWLPAVARGFPANGALVFGVHLARSGLDSV